MHVLVARAALGSEPCRPMDDERVRHAALVSIPFKALEGRVARPGPTPRVMVVGPRRAEIVNALEILLEALGMKLKKYCSLNDPLAPPSADAPLSLMTMTIVLSVSSSSSMKSSIRATCASVWVRKPA